MLAPRLTLYLCLYLFYHRTQELTMAARITRNILVVPTMYTLMSLNEYMTHRYFQHLEFNRPGNFMMLKNLLSRFTGKEPMDHKVPGDGHVEHHAETYDDMSLKNDARWRSNSVAKALDADPFRGTAFHWSATMLMTIQMLPSVFPTYLLMGWSALHTLAILLPSMLIHAIVWNAVHPTMHGLPPVALKFGFGTGAVPGGKAFSNWILESRYGRYIYENHMGHHVLGGQANYNVCCPLTDHIKGTYVKTEDWQPKMRPLPVNAEVRGAPVEPVTHGGVPQLPTIEEYKALQLLQKQMKEDGRAPAAVANGGTIIADAYSSEEDLKVESEALLK
jgi:hypothetical protein